jgi:hypothetical protein
MKKDIVVDASLVAACGLYCGACNAYLKGRCPGCRENVKAGWCSVRTCCKEHEYSNCAACGEFKDPRECGKFNNFISKIFALVFRSDRVACIRMIREKGVEAYASHMAREGRQSLKRV